MRVLNALYDSKTKSQIAYKIQVGNSERIIGTERARYLLLCGIEIEGLKLSVDNKEIEICNNINIIGFKVYMDCLDENQIYSENRTDISNKELILEVCNRTIIRDIQTDLDNWYSRYGRTNVIKIEGPKQVGKTTEAIKFALKHYKNIVYIDADDTKHIGLMENLDVFNSGLTFKKYCEDIEENFTDDKNTVVIFDNTQKNYRLYNILNKLQSTLRCDIIAVYGLAAKVRNPVYNVQLGLETFRMRTLSFEEFCRARGCDEYLYTLSAINNKNMLAHRKMVEEYRVYTQIGGYPAVVDRFLKSEDTLDLFDCNEILGKLLEDINEDCEAYIDYNNFEELHTEIAYSIVCRKIGRDEIGTDVLSRCIGLFSMTDEDKLKDALIWLINCGIIEGCDCYIDKVENICRRQMKLYYMDCGLARYIYDLAGIPVEEKKNFIDRCFIFNELSRRYSNFSTKGIRGYAPTFMILNDTEIDFVIEDFENNVYGVQVRDKDSNEVRQILDIEDTKHKYFAIIASERPGNVWGCGVSNKITVEVPIYLLGRGLLDIIETVKDVNKQEESTKEQLIDVGIA